MTDTYSSTERRTITAFYDRSSDAEAAMSRLRAEGIRDADMRLVEGNRPGMAETRRDGVQDRSPGFWESLADLFMPDEDRHTYAEGLSRGGYLLTVTAGPSVYDRALDILDDEGTVDMDERSSSWRSEGWTGVYEGSDYTSPARTMSGTSPAGLTRADSGIPGRDAALGTGTGTSGSAAATGTSAWTDRAGQSTGRDADSIPVVQEELRVGKRDVAHGRVRVRSYVVEEPVEKTVGLRTEHVHVERRPVDRAADAGDQLFRERSIEAEERAEEAVISKDARVVEEVSLRKDVNEAERRVSDTVRRTEVEVEDERTASQRNDGTRINR
jgi:uncharacterized protein (TIGR02271 family)